MGESIKLDDFGHFIFTIKFKRKSGGVYYTHFDIEGARVIELDSKNVLLEGTDGEKYLVTRRRIKHFERMECK